VPEEEALCSERVSEEQAEEAPSSPRVPEEETASARCSEQV
jgi:hypothetical protein